MYSNNIITYYVDVLEPVPCEDGDIRLAGNSTNQGRVEICRGNVWGSVCHLNNHRVIDALVMCRMLGYNSLGKLLSD